MTTQQEIQKNKSKAWYHYTCRQWCYIQEEDTTPFCKSNTTIDAEEITGCSRYKDFFGEASFDEHLLEGFKATKTEPTVGYALWEL